MKNLIALIIAFTFASCAQKDTVKTENESVFRIDTVYSDRMIWFTLNNSFELIYDKEESKWVDYYKWAETKGKRKVKKENEEIFYHLKANSSILYDEKDSLQKWQIYFQIEISGNKHKGFSKLVLEIDSARHNFEAMPPYNVFEVSNDKVIFNILLTGDEGLNTVQKITNSNIVKLKVIGRDKDEFILSPKIIEDSKIVIEYYNKLKTTNPIINY